VKKPNIGRMGEEISLTWLMRNGFVPRPMRARSPFDILCEQRRLEVKTSPEKDGYWHFNIHRRGVLAESTCDAYILVMLGDPTLMYVVPSPIGCKVLTVHRAHLCHLHWINRAITRDRILRVNQGWTYRYDQMERTCSSPFPPANRGPRSFRPTEHDETLIANLTKRMQVDFSTLVRAGLNRLAEVNGV
jgi:hypothetical protein